MFLFVLDSDQPSPSIPFDIICAIIEWLDVPSLKNMSLLNKECSHPARLPLFKWFRISTTAGPDPLQPIRDACAFIAGGDILLRVERLTVDVRCGLGMSEEEKDIVLEEMFAACGLMKRVASLDILLPPALHAVNVPDRLCLIHALSAISFPVLAEFSINAADLSGLDQFWTEHPTLTTLRILDPLPFHVSGLSDSFSQRLPLLVRVELDSDVQSRIIRGSTITHFHLNKLNSNHPIHLISNLASCGATIEHFSFGDIRAPRGLVADNTPAPSALYTNILPQLSRLSFLCIIDSFPDQVYSRGRRELALNGLSSLECMQAFEWRGNISPPAQAAFFDACSSRCKSLKRVLFEFPSEKPAQDNEVVIYSRRGTEDPWVVTEDR